MTRETHLPDIYHQIYHLNIYLKISIITNKMLFFFTHFDQPFQIKFVE